MGELKSELTDQQLTINELKRELQLFKDFMRAMRVSNPAMRAIADQMERYIADAPPPLPNIHSVVKHSTHETSAAILQSAEKTY